MQIKSIIFDLAGVLLNLDLEKDTQALLAVGLPDFDECLRRPEIAQPALKYLNGLIDEKEFLPQIRPYCRPDVTDPEIIESMNAVLADLPKSRMELLVSLRQHYKVYLLSNLNESDWQYTQALIQEAGYQVDQLFDRTFISYQMHMAKPDPRIFEEVIRATGIQPAETLYLDDTRENIESGRKMGFQAHLVPMNQLESILDGLLCRLDEVE